MEKKSDLFHCKKNLLYLHLQSSAILSLLSILGYKSECIF